MTLQLCQNVIPMDSDKNGRMQSNTYCMRPRGHEDKCAPQATDEDRKRQAEPAK